ncbi:MAG: hypothetical protein AAFO69_01540 [Bacteroidota bacterium]
MKYNYLNDQFAKIVAQLSIEIDANRTAQYRTVLTELVSHFKGLVAIFSEEPAPEKVIKRLYALQEILESLLNKENTRHPEDHFPVFFHHLSVLLADLPEQVIMRQNRDNYFNKPTDKWHIKVVKSLKLLMFILQFRVNQVFNLFRSRKKIVRFWLHQIPVKQVATRHFKSRWVNHLQEVNVLEFQTLCEELLKLKSLFDQHMDGIVEKAADTSSLTAMQETINQHLNSSMSQQQAEFEEAIAKVGTVELSDSQYAATVVEREYQVNVASWQQQRQTWENNLSALIEKWRSEVELMVLEQRVYLQLSQFESSQTIELLDELSPDIEASKAFLAKIRQQVMEQEDGNLTSILKKIRYQTQKEFIQGIIPRLSTNIINQNICNQINRLEAGIVKKIDALTGNFLIDKSVDYFTATSSTEINRVPTKELISFKRLPAYRLQLEEVRKELFLLLQKISEEVNSLGQVLQYSVGAAISAAEDTVSTAPQQVTQFIQGIDRAEVLLDKISAELSSTVARGVGDVKQHTVSLAEDLTTFNNVENVLKLRIDMAKAKASQKAQQYREQVLRNIGKNRNRVKENFLLATTWLDQKLKWVNKRILLVSSENTISKELTDFLRESQEVTGKLPAIYKRLYKIEPLEEEELFVGRTAELTQLKNACAAWKSGRYAASVIVGEKYGGITSFLNYALPKLPVSCPIIRFEQDDNIASAEELVTIFQKIIPDATFNNLSELADQLNSSYERIIVLEDLHNLFIRKIEGFTALKQLYMLINQTLKKVFWITSTTSHTWEYLERTTNVSEFFSYQIRMEEFSKEQITELINKRNRISGYQISFANDADSKTQKKLTKLEQIDQQVVLEDLFFVNLNEFAKGNISLALRYWLLSTISVTESTIEVGTFRKPDLSFVKLMSMEKVFILHALILHDGLTAPQLSEVINTSVGKCHLNLIAMLEDGIINQSNEAYYLNPLLYRNVLGLLKSKNLLQG